MFVSPEMALQCLEQALSKSADVETEEHFLAFAKKVNGLSADFVFSCGRTNHPDKELATETIPRMRSLLAEAEAQILHMALSTPALTPQGREFIEIRRQHIAERREELLQTAQSIIDMAGTARPLW